LELTANVIGIRAHRPVYFVPQFLTHSLLFTQLFLPFGPLFYLPLAQLLPTSFNQEFIY